MPQLIRFADKNQIIFNRKRRQARRRAVSKAFAGGGEMKDNFYIAVSARASLKDGKRKGGNNGYNAER